MTARANKPFIVVGAKLNLPQWRGRTGERERRFVLVTAVGERLVLVRMNGTGHEMPWSIEGYDWEPYVEPPVDDRWVNLYPNARGRSHHSAESAGLSRGKSCEAVAIRKSDGTWRIENPWA